LMSFPPQVRVIDVSGSGSSRTGVSNLNPAATTIPSRDTFLDCLKGFAIGTVVLGHTFQGATPDFDHSLPFRLVYSFHMPMFMFVAGMTTSLSFSKRLNARPDLLSYASEIRSKAVRLVVPFITWAMIKYFVDHPEGYNPATWLLHVFQFPDNGLWFLWAAFQCSCLLALICIGVQYAFHSLTAASADERNNPTALYLLLILAWPVASVMLRHLPYDLGLGLAKTFFPYFFAGFAFHIIRPSGLPIALRWIPYVIFMALAPFWYRMEASPVALLFPNPGSANLEYQRIVALAGTLAFVDFARFFADNAPALLTRAVAFIGKRSLDVYAIHFYFLAYFPPVIAPIAISLGVSFILRTNFVTSWLCLGQRPMRIWPIHRYLRSPSGSGMTDSATAIPKE
jgi:fucose 4-O-acetylase-like acetyltransferase